MTQDDFKTALRSMAAEELPAAPAAHDVAGLVLGRDRRRTRGYAALALVFWTLGAAGLFWLTIALNRFVVFLRIAPGLPWSRTPSPEDSRDAVEFMTWGSSPIHHAVPYVAAAIACLLLAAVFTVLMIFSSQQSTLNRINLSLARIAEQVKSAGLSAGVNPSPVTQIGPDVPDERNGMRSFLLALVVVLGVAGTIAYATLPTSRPWHGYPRVSPFEAVRYPSEGKVEVKVSGAWYELQGLNEVSTVDLIAACQSLDKKDWQKRLEEDLVEVLVRSKHDPADANAVELRVKDLKTGEAKTLRRVDMTEVNRQALWRARNK